MLLVFGLLVAFGALMLRLSSVAFGPAARPGRAGAGVLRADVRASRAGAGAPGSSCRAPLVAWFQHVAALLG